MLSGRELFFCSVYRVTEWWLNESVMSVVNYSVRSCIRMRWGTNWFSGFMATARIQWFQQCCTKHIRVSSLVSMGPTIHVSFDIMDMIYGELLSYPAVFHTYSDIGWNHPCNIYNPKIARMPQYFQSYICSIFRFCSIYAILLISIQHSILVHSRRVGSISSSTTLILCIRTGFYDCELRWLSISYRFALLWLNTRAEWFECIKIIWPTRSALETRWLVGYRLEWVVLARQCLLSR